MIRKWWVVQSLAAGGGRGFKPHNCCPLGIIEAAAAQESHGNVSSIVDHERIYLSTNRRQVDSCCGSIKAGAGAASAPTAEKRRRDGALSVTFFWHLNPPVEAAAGAGAGVPPKLNPPAEGAGAGAPKRLMLPL